MSTPFRASVQRLIADLVGEQLDSLSDIGPARLRKRSVPNGITLDEAKAIVDAACASRRLRIASIRGTCVAHRYHTALFTHIALSLAGSRIICLNVGEFTEASESAYRALVDTLPETYVDNLYWQHPDPMAGSGLKESAQDALRRNRTKPFYRAQLLRDEVWSFLKFGCKAWFNPKESTRRVSQELWSETAPTARCKQACRLSRCKGVNRHDNRCCLCTRHMSGYCYHHRLMRFR